MSVCDRGHQSEQVAGEVHPTPLMTGALEAAAQGGDETGVLIGDHQLHPAEPTRPQRPQELAPEHFLFGVADVAAQDLPGAIRGDAGGHDDGHRGDLRRGVADMEIGGVEIHVRELDVIQRTRAERTNDLIEPGTDP